MRLRAAAPASAGDVRSDALAHGVLVVRLPVFEWMLALAVYGHRRRPDSRSGDRRAHGCRGVGSSGRRCAPEWTRPVLAADLVIAAGVIAVGARFPRPATVYPVTATLTRVRSGRRGRAGSRPQEVFERSDLPERVARLTRARLAPAGLIAKAAETSAI